MSDNELVADEIPLRRMPFVLDETKPIQQQLTENFKEAIVSMKLIPGQLLPSSRELAQIFGVSRATAVRVYTDLIAQGYAESVEGKGTFVRKQLVVNVELPADANAHAMKLSGFANHLMQLKPEKLTAHDFPEMNHGCSPSEYLPLNEWKQALLESSRNLKNSEVEYGTDPFGHLPLRKAICSYLGRQRMINCTADRLVLCASSTYLLHLVAQLLVGQGDLVAFPDPGPIYARDVFNTLGVELFAVEVDDNGLNVEKLMSHAAVPKLIYLNSSHQDPGGACLSFERRMALLTWAVEKNIAIIEDEYDADYRYASTPSPPLRALSPIDRIIYIGSFWRTLYPLVNLSYLVAPPPVVPVVTQAWNLLQHAFHSHFPFIDQLALTTMLNSGEYEKHTHRNQAVFANRWRNCVYELTRTFGQLVKVEPESSTYHMLIQFHGNFDEERLMRCAAAAGIALLPAKAHYISAEPSGKFLLPFAHINEEKMSAGLRSFRQRLGEP